MTPGEGKFHQHYDEVLDRVYWKTDRAGSARGEYAASFAKTIDATGKLTYAVTILLLLEDRP